MDTLIGDGFYGISTVASAATVDLGALHTIQVYITGTTTITSFGPGAGKIRWLTFTDVLTLTQSSSLILPGGAPIVTAAGDRADAVSNASGDWVVRHYTRAAVAP